jgi:hypothetical protein
MRGEKIMAVFMARWVDDFLREGCVARYIRDRRMKIMPVSLERRERKRRREIKISNFQFLISNFQWRMSFRARRPKRRLNVSPNAAMYAASSLLAGCMRKMRASRREILREKKCVKKRNNKKVVVINSIYCKR